MHIRTFTMDDLAAARELWSSAEGMRPPPTQEIVRKLERDPDLFLVGEVGDQLVGVVMGTYDGRRGWIFRLAVAPSHRRRGVGTRLVSELERRFTERGIHRIRLLAFEGNTTARRFWGRLGYEEVSDVVMFSKDLTVE